jgi:predicted RNA-binding protein YlxR (DUF448 family)
VSGSGKVALDPTGKANGRGAYLCKKPSCWTGLAATSALNKALNVEMDVIEFDMLAEQFRSGILK